MKTPLPAVGAVILQDNRVLLVKRRDPPSALTWAIPGGKVEFGETLESAVKREIKEETNLEIEVKEPIAIVEVISEGFHYVIIDFKGLVLKGDLTPRSDALDARFFDIEEAISMKETNLTTKQLLLKLSNGEKAPFHIIQISR